MERYNYLIRLLDAFIDVFGGAKRIRGIQTLLLVQQATLFGSGISASDLHRRTTAPVENIRRRFRRFKALGLVDAHPDPTDDRVTLFTVTSAGEVTWPAARVITDLHAIGPPGAQFFSRPVPLASATYDGLVAVLEAFATAFGAQMRIRGFRTALLIQQATVAGTGISTTTLARATNAPPETVRRHMLRHTAFGDLRLTKDPDDDRAVRVFSAHPDRGAQTWAAVIDRLDALDWRLFHIQAQGNS